MHNGKVEEMDLSVLCGIEVIVKFCARAEGEEVISGPPITI